MAVTTALLVADNEDAVSDLVGALGAADVAVTRTTTSGLAARPMLYSDVELVLVSASLGLQQVALIAQRAGMGEAPPTVMVFPEDDFAALEECVRGGFDYVMPPFLPGLLLSRMISCSERWQLTMTVEEMATAASVQEYERDLSIAREIQSGFLPSTLPAASGWEFAARFRPARQVGGDFYDGFELLNGRRLGFVVADVCDKGVGAALFMALIRTLLRHTAEYTGTGSPLDASQDILVSTAADAGKALSPLLSVGAGPLVQAVLGTNRYLARNHLRQGYFATLFFGVLDPVSGALLYINGGHNPPVLVRANGSRELLTPTGPAVGMMPGSAYTLGHTALQPGDSLLLYTDGVVEARDPAGGLFGMDRMTDILTRPVNSAEDLLHSIDNSLSEFVSTAHQFDDITMLALHRQGR